MLRAKENFLAAAKLAHVESRNYYGSMLNESDPERWYWWGLVSVVPGESFFFLRFFVRQIELFCSDPSLAPVVFVIGRSLKGHVNVEKKTDLWRGKRI